MRIAGVFLLFLPSVEGGSQMTLGKTLSEHTQPSIFKGDKGWILWKVGKCESLEITVLWCSIWWQKPCGAAVGSVLCFPSMAGLGIQISGSADPECLVPSPLFPVHSVTELRLCWAWLVPAWVQGQPSCLHEVVPEHRQVCQGRTPSHTLFKLGALTNNKCEWTVQNYPCLGEKFW